MKRRCAYLVGFVTCLTFVILPSFLPRSNSPNDYFNDSKKRRDFPNHLSSRQSSRAYVTSHQNPNVLFFNRVPKTGSEMLVLLLQWLQGQNGFKHVRLENSVPRHLSRTHQLSLAAEMGEILATTEESRVSFDRHIHFTNFTTLGLKMPLLVNMVRDPVEKIASRFYYARVTPRPGAPTPPNYSPPSIPPFKSLEECIVNRGADCTFVSGREYDLTIPYFCGHEKFCRVLNDPSALSKAKRNVELWYSAVGVLENVNATLTVFEDVLPQFFKGVTQIYYQELMGLHHNKNRQKPKISEEAKLALKKTLQMEFEFYDFLLQKLQKSFSQTQNRI